MADKIKVYALKVPEQDSPIRRMPYKGFITEIDNTLDAIQSYVGGYFQPVVLKPGIIAVCDEDGKMKQKQPNRGIIYNGKIVDIFVGNIFVCRTDGENMTSINEPDIAFIDSILVPIAYVTGNTVHLALEGTLSEYEE